MPLFGGLGGRMAYPQPLQSLGTTALAPPIDPVLPKRRGLFGSMAAAFNPMSQDQPTVWDFLINGPTGVRERAQEIDERKTAQGLAQGDPAAVQAWAKIDPAGYTQFKAAQSLPKAPEYQGFDNGGVFNKTTGKWEQAPQPKAEFGWTRNPDGTLTPIKGGPADPEYKQKVNPKAFVINAGGGIGASPLSGDAITNAAVKYNETGVLPSLGVGKAGATYKAQVLNKAAELAAASGDDAKALVAKGAAFKANQSALQQNTKLATAVGGFERTLHGGLKIALNLSQKVGRSGSPIFNKWVLAGKKQLAGDPDVTAFETSVQTVANEYAKIMSGSLGNSPVSDSARAHAREILNAAMTPDQFQANVQVLLQEIEARKKGIAEENAGLMQSLGNGSPMGGVGGDPQTDGGVVKWGRDASGKIVKMQ